MAASFDRYAVLLTNKLDGYRMQLISGISPVLADHGISLLIHSADPFQAGPSVTLANMLYNTRPHETPDHVRPCGIIATQGATATYMDELLGQISDLAIPVTAIAMDGLGGINIRGDNTASTSALMAHLFDDRGVRRPVLVRGIAGQRDSTEREALIRHEMARRGIPLDENLIIDGDFEIELAYSNMRALMRTRRDMDAVIAFNDLSAMGAWRALKEGLRVPEDVLLSGFDNNHVAAINWPGLTTVENDLKSQGAAAAAGLISQILGDAPDTERLLPGQLIIRGSTGLRNLGAEAERDIAVTMAEAAQRQLAEQDALLAFNQAMMRCATTAEMVEALASTHLDRLGINRCVLAVYEWENDHGSRERSSTNASGMRLLLDYSNGASRALGDGPLSIYELLRHELRRETMVFQPLSIADRSLGWMLYEYTQSQGVLPEILRIDLSRTLGAVLGSQDLKEYAQTLEDKVDRRTQELKQEIATRRRAEAELQRLNAGLQRSLMIDGLTGIANRAALERHFELHGPAGPSTEEVALLFIDVDLFKAYNDLYGHVMGDEALRNVASCLTQAVRYPQDLACRWGGEEFAVLLPGSGVDGATIVAERFMSLLEEARIPHAASTVAKSLTASVGIAVAISHPGLNATDLIEAADQALYAAKTLGRHRICWAEPILQPAGTSSNPAAVPHSPGRR